VIFRVFEYADVQYNFLTVVSYMTNKLNHCNVSTYKLKMKKTEKIYKIIKGHFAPAVGQNADSHVYSVTMLPQMSIITHKVLKTRE